MKPVKSNECWMRLLIWPRTNYTDISPGNELWFDNSGRRMGKGYIRVGHYL